MARGDYIVVDLKSDSLSVPFCFALQVLKSSNECVSVHSVYIDSAKISRCYSTGVCLTHYYLMLYIFIYCEIFYQLYTSSRISCVMLGNKLLKLYLKVRTRYTYTIYVLNCKWLSNSRFIVCIYCRALFAFIGLYIYSGYFVLSNIIASIIVYALPQYITRARTVFMSFIVYSFIWTYFMLLFCSLSSWRIICLVQLIMLWIQFFLGWLLGWHSFSVS